MHKMAGLIRSFKWHCYLEAWKLRAWGCSAPSNRAWQAQASPLRDQSYSRWELSAGLGLEMLRSPNSGRQLSVSYYETFDLWKIIWESFKVICWASDDITCSRLNIYLLLREKKGLNTEIGRSNPLHLPEFVILVKLIDPSINTNLQLCSKRLKGICDWMRDTR